MSTAKKEKAIVLGATDEGTIVAVQDGDSVRVGVATPQEDGVPFDPANDVVRFTEADDGTIDCETVYRGTARTTSRPATKSYTKGWDRIFGAKKTSASANLN